MERKTMPSLRQICNVLENNQKPVGHAEALVDTSTVSLFICLMIFGRPMQQYYGEIPIDMLRV